MAGEYPRYIYFPRPAKPPGWVAEVSKVFADASDAISTEAGVHKTSDEVLAVLRPGLERIGFKVESGKLFGQKLHRPVLFKEMGDPDVSYEIDAYHEGQGILLEIEAGRAIMGNSIYRDIVQMSLMVDARYAIVGMPLAYRYISGGRNMTNLAYRDGKGILDAIWSSGRLRLPFEGMLLIGY